MRPRPRTLSALAVAVALGAAACSDDPAEPASAAADTPTSPTSDRAATTAATIESTAPATVAATTVSEASTTTASTTTAPATTTSPTTTPAADATSLPPTAEFAPIGPGPYDVGVATIVLDDPERPLTVDVWFPIDRATDLTALSPQQYTFIPGVYYESPRAYAATADLVADGPFPLVVYSHGSGGLRYIHSSMTEAIASHGFVVAAADHTGNTTVERLLGTDAPPAEIAVDRPTDVTRLIDALTDATDAAGGAFARHTDADLIVVAGHSLGGFTAIATVIGFANEAGTVEPDERVDAIVAIAPAIDGWFSAEALASIDVPVLALVGSDDATTPVDPHITRLWDAVSMSDGASPAYRVVLEAAEHQTFTDVCAYQVALPSLANVPPPITDTIDQFAVEGCSDDDMPIDRAIELTDTYVVWFLDEVLRDGPSPASVTPPTDVAIEAT